MVFVFVPFLVATIALIAIHRRARLRDEDPPLGIGVVTGVVLGLVLAEVLLLVVAVVQPAV